MKYYHVSIRRLTVGTKLLRPSELRAKGLKTAFDFKYEGHKDYVYLHAHAVPHWTTLELDIEVLKKAHIYEVMPLSDVIYGSNNEELLCESAVITKYVGNAWGIYNNIPYTSSHYYKCITKHKDVKSTKLVKIKGRGRFKPKSVSIKTNLSVSAAEIRLMQHRNNTGEAYISNRKFHRLYDNILEDKRYIGWDELQKLKAKKDRLIAKLGNKSK